MASTDENPGLLARFYGSRQESSTRRKSAERPFPHNVRGSTAASTTAANCLYPDTTRGRRNVGRVAETLTSRPGRGRKDPSTAAHKSNFCGAYPTPSTRAPNSLVDLCAGSPERSSATTPPLMR